MTQTEAVDGRETVRDPGRYTDRPIGPAGRHTPPMILIRISSRLVGALTLSLAVLLGAASPASSQEDFP